LLRASSSPSPPSSFNRIRIAALERSEAQSAEVLQDFARFVLVEPVGHIRIPGCFSC
jgi:hypothetical protein